MRNKKQWKIAIVATSSRSRRRSTGSARPRSRSRTFCTKYGINRFWWTPPEGSKKLLMVDFQDFRQCWSHVHGKPRSGAARRHPKTRRGWTASKRGKPKPKTKTTSKNPPYLQVRSGQDGPTTVTHLTAQRYRPAPAASHFLKCRTTGNSTPSIAPECVVPAAGRGIAIMILTTVGTRNGCAVASAGSSSKAGPPAA